MKFRVELLNFDTEALSVFFGVKEIVDRPYKTVTHGRLFATVSAKRLTCLGGQ